MPQGRCQFGKPDTRPKVRKQAWERDRDHLAFIRHLPCAGCNNKPPVEAAHVRNGSDGAVSRKPSDRYAVPLCPPCHGSQHNMGEFSFWSMCRGDPLDLAAKLWSLSRKYKGEQLIEMGRYAVQEWRRR
ncbi:MAG: hypothetical protein ACR2RF_26135 [Geminicoccaceae bacterium]